MLILPPYTGWQPGHVEKPRTLVDFAALIIDAAVDKFELDEVWVLYSGGHDSLVAMHVASKHPKFGGAIHVKPTNSPLANKVSRYARAVCKRYGWRCVVQEPFTTLPMLISKYGCPGPQMHELFMRYLKERPYRDAKRKVGGKKEVTGKNGKPRLVAKRIGFISGVRRAESKNRENAPYFDEQDGNYFILPIADWTKQDLNAYITINGLQRNFMNDAVGISGECDCNAHASPEEIRMKEELDVKQRQWHEAVEKLAQAAYELQQLEVRLGLRAPENAIKEMFTRLGHGHGTLIQRNQMELPGFRFSLCNTCEGQLDSAGNVGIDPDKWLNSERSKVPA